MARFPFQDLVGRTFGRLTVTRLLEKTRKGARWLCLCQCGATHSVYAGHLHNGSTQSCGCLRREVTSARYRKHGEGLAGRRTPEYQAWAGMLDRCRPGGVYYPRIPVCDQWQDYSTFLADMGRRPSPKHSIDRIDNDKGYEPGNCRWATIDVQSRNKRNNIFLEHNGERLCVKDWSRRLGVAREAIMYRLRRGWSVEQVLTVPFKRCSRKRTHARR